MFGTERMLKSFRKNFNKKYIFSTVNVFPEKRSCHRVGANGVPYEIMFEFDNPGAPMSITLQVPNGEGYFLPSSVYIPSGISYPVLNFWPLNGFTGGVISIMFEGEVHKKPCLQKWEFKLPELCSEGRYMSPEVVKVDRMTVAPNPAKETTAIYYEVSGDVSQTVFEVHDLIGRPLYQFRPSSFIGTESLDCSRYAEGTYLISMRVNGQVVKQTKFVVRKQ